MRPFVKFKSILNEEEVALNSPHVFAPLPKGHGVLSANFGRWFAEAIVCPPEEAVMCYWHKLLSPIKAMVTETGEVVMSAGKRKWK